jgi:hypothetical protein
MTGKDLREARLHALASVCSWWLGRHLKQPWANRDRAIAAYLPQPRPRRAGHRRIGAGMKRNDEYEPDQLSIIERPVDADLDDKLTSKKAVETVAHAIKGATFVFDPDDLVTIATAESLQIQDGEEYRRGFELLDELSSLETRISSHYVRFDKPLNFLIGIVRKLKGSQHSQVGPVKQALSRPTCPSCTVSSSGRKLSSAC